VIVFTSTFLYRFPLFHFDIEFPRMFRHSPMRPIQASAPFSRLAASALERIRVPPLSDPFDFVVNGRDFACDLFQAILIAPAVHKQLSADSSLRRFVIRDDHIDSTHFSCLQQLFAGETISLRRESRRSLLLLSQGLGNADLEQLFFGLLFAAPSSEAISLSLSDLLRPSGFPELFASNFHSYSKDDLSILSVDTLHDILSADSLRLSSEDWLLRFVLDLGKGYASLFRHIRFEFLSEELLTTFFDRCSFADLTEDVWKHLLVRLKNSSDCSLRGPRFVLADIQPGALPAIESTIITDFPTIFADFRSAAFRLIYRGTRDGFGGKDFHRHCDGHKHTLTVILTKHGYVFGGYTPIEWESPIGWKQKCDNTLTSFLFTLKNPHQTAALKFPLQENRKQFAIYCCSSYGPTFGGYDIYVCDKCDVNGGSYTHNFGETYLNTSALDRRTLFTGESKFFVKEIEVFEIIK
jgi:hypothetical protein